MVRSDTKVIVGVPTAEFARRADFYDYLNLLDLPPGTIKTCVHGQSPARNRNVIINQAIEHNCTHILFLDDDVTFKPNLLTSLLAHDKDIVSGLYLMRAYPHQPIIFDVAKEDGMCRHYYPTDEESGLVEIVTCGFGAVLIKTEIFKSLEKPYVRLGELELDHWCDDTGFFKRVRAAGFKLYCDLDIQVGHIASCIVWPGKINGKWNTIYDTGGRGLVNFPSLKPSTVVDKDQLELEICQ